MFDCPLVQPRVGQPFVLRQQCGVERILDDISFTAPDRTGDTVTVDAAFVDKNLGELTRSVDMSRYVL